MSPSSPPSSPERRYRCDEESAADILKLQMVQSSGSKSTTSPSGGILELLVGKHSQEMGSAQSGDRKHGESENTAAENVKDDDQSSVHPNAAVNQSSPEETFSMEDGPVEKSNELDKIVTTEGIKAEETCKIGRHDGLYEVAQQNNTVSPALRSPIKHDRADSQKMQIAIRSAPQLHSQEEQESAKNEKRCQDGILETAAGTTSCINNGDSSQSIAPADDAGATEKASRKGGTGNKSSSEKKRKRKHSGKRSKSRNRSRSSKRSKIPQTASPEHQQGDAEITEHDDESPNKFNIAQTKAKIPKGCSVSHENTQKEELKEGTKLFESKKFRKMMVSSLHNHQIPVTSWMVKRERDSQRLTCGGIVADEMGLGKTVVSLACIAANTLKKKDRNKSSQATLVVVPNAKVANQWISEAKKHWHEDASAFVTIYSTDGRGIQQFEKQWIV
ncbi:hypothetical protein Trco_007102 [Trichoderma cornu-damae]|uniref:SNF2 N-terminal domain-containing protein n=1 Tax=Trichoderma cornu-damae TaxID=654480 RepID=A0A9P8QHL8_9HYPO|nr:hypothetical protein Trco_007102 [Trichoderma cornu-damae]